MRNIKLTIEYDGTNYNGWQYQPQSHVRTVQGLMEESLALITHESTRLIVAGRTDAGVHALGQIANFCTGSRIPLERIPYAANCILPDDIVVVSSEEVDPGFHAQHSARGKTYTYLIWNLATPSAFYSRYSWHMQQSLNVKCMQEAALHLQGQHDFRSFCASGSSVKNYVRELTACTVIADGNLLRITVEANGFLYNMVRIIVGTLVDVGRGKLQPADLAEIIASHQRETAGSTAPPQGLFLVRVHY
ncbi:MAG: tRNA pseudouridine(38-40) synthase TruA [Bacillota bacterium]